MLRYWVFVGEDYEANGGVADLKGMFDTIDEAIDCVQATNAARSFGFDWYDIVDVELGAVVRSNRLDESDQGCLNGLIVCPDETNLFANPDDK